MSKYQRHNAFSLVEAMIILVLISVAIMALIPLLNAKKTTFPKWGPIKDNNGQIVGTYYGLNASERVGLGIDTDGNRINPYAVDKNAKFALSKLLLKGNSDLNSIAWTDYFVNAAYNVDAGGNRNIPKVLSDSIEIGMNACSDAVNAQGFKTVIRSATAAGSCNPANTDMLNIGNRIIGKAGTATIAFGLSIIDNQAESDLRNNANIYVSHGQRAGNNTTYDIFIFRYPSNNSLAMRYSENPNVGLTVAPSLTVLGDLYLKGYQVTENATSGTNLQCDGEVRDGIYQCYGEEDIGNYYWGNRANYKTEGSASKTFYNAAQAVWTAPSDIRLKNVIESYKKGIKDILKVDTYLYTFKSDKKQQIRVGIIAQKLIGVFDEALHRDANGYYSYERNPLMYALTNSAKEVNDKQNKLVEQQEHTLKEADKLIRMYK